jgi:hypothetical protein
MSIRSISLQLIENETVLLSAILSPGSEMRCRDFTIMTPPEPMTREFPPQPPPLISVFVADGTDWFIDISRADWLKFEMDSGEVCTKIEMLEKYSLKDHNARIPVEDIRNGVIRFERILIFFKVR